MDQNNELNRRLLWFFWVHKMTICFRKHEGCVVNLSCLHYTVTATSHVSIMVFVGIKLDYDYSVTRTMAESYISARMRFAELHKKGHQL